MPQFVTSFSALLAAGGKIRMVHGFAMSEDQMKRIAVYCSKLLLDIGIPASKTVDADPHTTITRILLRSRDTSSCVGKTGIISRRWAESDNRPEGFEDKTIILIVMHTAECGPLLEASRLKFNPEDERTKRGMDWLMSAGLTEEDVIGMWVSIPLYYLYKGDILPVEY